MSPAIRHEYERELQILDDAPIETRGDKRLDVVEDKSCSNDRPSYGIMA